MPKISPQFQRYYRPRREPGVAAALSVISGLGQLYNGERRKGYLFLAVFLANVQAIFSLTFNKAYLEHLQIGVAQCSALICILGIFTVYAMKDAYNGAIAKQKHITNQQRSLDLSEAASVSFILHYIVFMACLLLSVLFFKPSSHLNEVTSVVFLPKQPAAKERVHAPARASNSSRLSGEHKSMPIVTPSSTASLRSSIARAVAKAPQSALPQMRPQSASQVNLRPITRTIQPPRLPEAHSQPTDTRAPNFPAVRSTISRNSTNMANALPQPLKIANSANSIVSPAPALSRASNNGFIPAPKMAATLPGNGASPAGPIPINPNSESAGQKSAPQVVPSVRTAPSLAGSGNPAPAPLRVSSGGNHPSISMVPQLPVMGTNTPGQSMLGNPAQNNNPNALPSAAAEQADFGPYMSELQRRIKHAWTPTKENQSKRVVVVFKIHKSGELSDLRLDRTCGTATADQAALKAVEDAAPFAALPKGCQDSVDIQFTFDYNVFSGGSGIFRKF